MTPLRRLCPLAGLTVCVFSVFLFAGCETRSVSDSSYRRHGHYGGSKTGYRGELNEFDVLGVERGGHITEEQIVTKTISWVPIVGWVVPDERQHMRIQVKMAVIDVRSGHWTMFAPESFESRAMSDKLSRESSDQGQVEKLKKLAYEAVATDLTKIYAN